VTRTTGGASTLRLSECDLDSYRSLAAGACEREEASWALAGIVPGARVAGIGGCAGLVLAALARLVAPDGLAVGVASAAEAHVPAEDLIGAEGLTKALVRRATAAATGPEPGSFDVVMQRHVLVHNGGRERAIVLQLASLLRPGGALYLVETDLLAVRVVPSPEPDLADLTDRWRDWMRDLGNDLSIGARLAELAAAAGLEVTELAADYDVVELGARTRPPAWAARVAMVAAGVATEADVERWDSALQRAERQSGERLVYVPLFRVVARRPPVATVSRS
jgi:SAM-dependent methyltransferase